MRNAAGFTLLELMLVMLLLGSVAGLIVTTLPRTDGRAEADKLMITLRWASSQAENSGQAYRLLLRENGWQLFRLARGGSEQPTFLPGYHWHKLRNSLNYQRLPSAIRLQLYHQQQPLTLPAQLLFLPGGDSADLHFTLQVKGVVMQRIRWHDEQAEREE